MIKTKASIEIRRPMHEVFNYVTTVENFPNWFGEVIQESRRVTPDSVGIGTVFTVVNEFLGRRFESQFTVTGYEADQLFCVATKWGPLPFEGCFHFEPVDGGTLVTDRHQIGSGGFFDLVGSLLVERLRRQSNMNLANLKTVLEGGAVDTVRSDSVPSTK
jgi:uncharacterized protein YndB with AHSA1/START domain